MEIIIAKEFKKLDKSAELIREYCDMIDKRLKNKGNIPENYKCINKKET